MLGQELDTLRVRLNEFHNRELEALRERNQSFARELAEVQSLGCRSAPAAETKSCMPELSGAAPAAGAGLAHTVSAHTVPPSPPDNGPDVPHPDMPLTSTPIASHVLLRPRASRTSANTANFVMREDWLALQKAKYRRSTLKKTMSIARSPTARLSPGSETRAQSVLGKAADARLSRCMVSPTGWLRSSWVMACMLMLGYDFTVVPLLGSFELHPMALIDMMAYLSAIFWSADLVLTFFTGAYTGGRLEMRPSRVAYLYMRTWLSFDIVMVTIEIVWLVSAQGDGMVSQLRGLRLLRWLRLLRLAKWSHVIDDAMLLVPEALVADTGIIKILLAMPFAIHLLSCTWYALGRADADGWAHSPDLEQAGLGRRYLVSAHWAITSLAGTSNADPRSTLEYLFSSAIVLGGMGFVAFLIAKVTMVMYTLQGTDKAKLQKFVRQYLRVRGVSTELSLRVKNYAAANRKHALGDKVEREGKLLESLPEVLQMDLHQEVRGPVLDCNRFFRDLREPCPRAVRSIIHEAISGMVAIPGELVFAIGDACEHMLFVESGSFRYEGGQVARESSVQVVREGSAGGRAVRAENSGASGLGSAQCLRGRCVSEAALWTKWEHQGDLSSESEGMVLSLDSAKIVEIVRHYDAACVYVGRYAKRFVANLNRLAAEDISVLSDIMDFDLPDSFEDSETKASVDSHFVFISHFKKEAGTEATLIQEAIERMVRDDPCNPASELQSPAFLDSEDLGDLTSLREHVKRSHNLILLLTDNVLLRPWCLVELVTAMQCDVQVVPVAIERPGVAFAYPDAAFYNSFREGKGFSQSDVQTLLGEGISLTDAEEAVRRVFLKIALPFSPHKSAQIRQAELRDILARCILTTPAAA